MPAPFFIGTEPQEWALERAELASQGKFDLGDPPKTFLASEPCSLLSLGCKVTTSDPEPFIGTPGMLTDGELETGDGYWLELMPGPQWVQLDLGAPCRLEAIWTWRKADGYSIFRDVIVAVSNDVRFVDARVLWNSDYQDIHGFGRGKDVLIRETPYGHVVAAAGQQARYVRLYSNGRKFDDMNYYIEVQVHGNRMPALGKD